LNIILLETHAGRATSKFGPLILEKKMKEVKRYLKPDEK
jgi:hypothetical protein